MSLPVTPRLSDAALPGLPSDVGVPSYDRAAVRTGVVHLGIGAFHRAHQAVVFDDALASGDLRWGVLGASLRSSSVAEQLNPQDGLYTVVVRDGGDARLRVIGAGRGVMVGPENPAALVAAMADADVHIVTLTVTEKGYRLDPASGKLKLEDPEVAADLADIASPRTAPGFIVAALKARHAKGLRPFTVISCDNLPHNGQRIRAGVLEMAHRIDPGLSEWISVEGAFPQTMIDRIVPATTPDDIDQLDARLGVRDAGMVKAEPFTQWVIEDRFAGERPDFAAFGVQLTRAVAPWEDAKLRLLNGAHSALAYLGGLAGFESVHHAVARPSYAHFIEALWDEAETTLSPPAELDVAAYRAALLRRFSNASLNHATRQIAMDGSQKLPQRLVASAAARIECGLPIPCLALAIAGWMRWQGGLDDAGRAFVVDDPMAEETRRLLDTAGADARTQARALLSLGSVFPARLASNPDFAEPIVDAYCALSEQGAMAAVEAGRAAK